MAESSLIQVRIDTKTKEEVTRLFDSLGLDTTTAVRIFLKKCLQEKGIPFELKNKDAQEPETESMQLRESVREEDPSEGISLDVVDAEKAWIAANKI